MTGKAQDTRNDQVRESGLPYALGAYLIWGLVPIFFKMLAMASPLEVVAQRVVWSIPLLFIIMLWRGQIQDFRQIWRDRALLRNLFLSSLLIGFNWLVYIWAVSNDHILAASLGYYLNPLINILLGRVFLGERLRRLQQLSVLIAVVAVAILLSGAIDTLWISLALACSFALYGLLRKVTPVPSVPGLGVETCLLAPFAAGIIIWCEMSGIALFGTSARVTALMILAGAVTAIPLVMFAVAARRMQYTTLGFVQFLAPTIVFLIGVFVYHEPLDMTRLACFGLIWLAIAIFSYDMLRNSRANRQIVAG